MDNNQQQTTCFIPFLARSQLYESEKPYAADFQVDGIKGAKMTNHIYDSQQVIMRDIRYLEQPLSIDVHGACVIRAKTSLRPGEEATMRTPQMRLYTSEILKILSKEFPEYKEIRVMDCGLRKRDPEFPHNHGKPVHYPQPAAMPHTDFSAAGAYLRMRDIFPGQQDWYGDRDFDLLNIWRVLKGPNDDWPLAICDYSTIDWPNDTALNDALHLNRIGENWLLHANPNQKWYYLSAMDEEDLLVFRNTDSKNIRSKCFHAAFNNSNSNGIPRESVEVRVVAFRD